MKTSLQHLPDHKQANIHAAVEIIQDEFDQVIGSAQGKKKHSRIVLIILFGSYAKGTWVDDVANGYISDYDLLVVLNNNDLVEDYKIWHTAEERIQRKLKAPINLLVHTHQEINDKLQQGHYFFTDIKAEGIQLYQYSNTQLTTPGKLSKEEAQKIAEKHYAQWFESANSFSIDYGHCMARKDYKKAAFELHQAVERYYGCFLLVFTNYLPKSHDLKRLRHLAIQQDQTLSTVFAQDTKFNRRCFELLKRAYIEARYSEHYEITDEALLWLAKQTEILRDLTQKLCLHKIEVL